MHVQRRSLSRRILEAWREVLWVGALTDGVVVEARAGAQQ